MEYRAYNRRWPQNTNLCIQTGGFIFCFSQATTLTIVSEDGIVLCVFVVQSWFNWFAKVITLRFLSIKPCKRLSRVKLWGTAKILTVIFSFLDYSAAQRTLSNLLCIWRILSTSKLFIRITEMITSKKLWWKNVVIVTSTLYWTGCSTGDPWIFTNFQTVCSCR